MQSFRKSPPLQSLPPKLFISYSHEDRSFVEKLVRDLVANRIIVWWDNWEIKVGDSLLQKIQEGITSSSYLSIVLTPSSVASSWVQEELNSALLRQLEERRVFVLPILAQECNIPLFVRGRKYADFRTDYSYGLSDLLVALKSPDTLSHSRGNTRDYFHDYAFEWGRFNNRHGFRLQITSHSEKTPYAINCLISVVANPKYSKRLDNLQKAGFEYGPCAVLLLFTQKLSESIDTVIFIEGDREAVARFTSYDPVRDVGFDLVVRARRLGSDPGEDILYEWKSVFDFAVQKHLDGIRTAHSPEELGRLDDWLDEHPLEPSS